MWTARHGRSRAAAAWTLPLALTVVVSGCTGTSAEEVESSGVPRFGVAVLDTRPHDTSAFTQGLEIDGDRLLEGTGLAGMSTVTASDLESGTLLAEVSLPAPLFGEGITLTDDTLWQVTWQDGTAFARDPVTLAERRQVRYDGEGWGLCFAPDLADGGSLVMSDGSDTLTFRDPVTFEPTGTVTVTAAGRPVSALNELECTPDGVYANVWQTDDIVRIDPSDGTVDAFIDASSLRASLPDPGNVDVLNGIAAIPGTDTFLMTGKLWPTMFEVRLVPE